MNSVTALANPNIALIKYWGDQDHQLHIPVNGSISMNLKGLFTRTQVSFIPDQTRDKLTINDEGVIGEPLKRVSKFLDQIRKIAGLKQFAEVTSINNFPMGTGIASSASAFAALSLAATTAVGLELDERELSRLARLGSGSACRSVPGGYVEWQAGESDDESYAYAIAPPEHWALVDCIAIVSQAHKQTGSMDGHTMADSSPLQVARVVGTPHRLEICRRAILARDFEALAEVVELDSNQMHAVMMTSKPPLLYWRPATIAIMYAVQNWRKEGLPSFYTVDAGPNVHVICQVDYQEQITSKLTQIQGVQRVIAAGVGGPARLEFR